MPYLTTKKPKAITKPWCSRFLWHPARKRSGSILGHNTHPGPTREKLDRTTYLKLPVHYMTTWRTWSTVILVNRTSPIFRPSAPLVLAVILLSLQHI